MKEEDVIALKLEIEDLKTLVEKQAAMIAWLKNQLMGSKSEKLDPLQAQLFDLEQGKSDPPPAPEVKSSEEEDKKPKKRNRRTKEELYTKHLPVVIKEEIIPLEVQASPEAWKKIGEEHHDELDYVPGQVRIARTIRAKYAHKANKATAPIISPAPQPSIPGTMITAAFGAHLLIDKYCDHLPHYRQSQRLEREQTITLGRQTINKWTHLMAEHLSPIATAIRSELLQSQVLQMDETPIKYIKKGNGKTKNGYLWLIRDPQTKAVYYHWHPERSADALLDTLGQNKETGELDFKGTIQCDGYSSYVAVEKLTPGIVLGSCMAHIRRKFIEDSSLEHQDWGHPLLRNIQELYRIEKKLREANAPPAEKQKMRQARSKPLADKIYKTLIEQKDKCRPQSKTGEAIRYALGQWDGLLRYLEDGRLDIDNNGIENAVRPTKLGRKNWLFFGNAEAGQNNADIYTLIENCKINGINPRDYLEYVFKGLKTQVPEELTPAKLAPELAVKKQAA